MSWQKSNNAGMLPECAHYFKQEIIGELLEIPSQKPDMEDLLNVMVWPEIEAINLIETKKGKSHEGQYLSGAKLIVEVKLLEKITYVANEPTQSVHAAHYETYKSMFVVLPEEIDGRNICELYRAGSLAVTPYVEASCAHKLDARKLYKCVLLFLDVKIC